MGLSWVHSLSLPGLLFYVQDHKKAEYLGRIGDERMGCGQGCATSEYLSPAGRQQSLRITSESLKRDLIQMTVLILSLFWEWCPDWFECFNCMYPSFSELLVSF